MRRINGLIAAYFAEKECECRYLLRMEMKEILIIIVKAAGQIGLPLLAKFIFGVQLSSQCLQNIG